MTQDLLVNDIVRIRRAKEVLRNPKANRRDKTEAIKLLNLYKSIVEEFDNERAKEIANELGYDYR